MNIEDAPAPVTDDDVTCPLCDSENTFVLYDGDKVCHECGYAPTSNHHTTSSEDPWLSWFEHRREEYSRYYGHERIRAVGGFAAAYEFDADFDR